MKKTELIKDSDINHLRRLLSYVRCEIGEDEQQTINRYAALSGVFDQELSEEAKERVMTSIKKSANVPRYVRAAVNALEKVVMHHDGEIVDAECCSDQQKSICSDQRND